MFLFRLLRTGSVWRRRENSALRLRVCPAMTMDVSRVEQRKCRFGATAQLHWRRSESVASSVVSKLKMLNFADESSTTPPLPDPAPFQHLADVFTDRWFADRKNVDATRAPNNSPCGRC